MRNPFKRRFKYKINRYLAERPRGLSRSDITFLLETDFFIEPSEFNEDRYLRIKDKRIIPTSRLRIYALIFKVTENDLKNFEIAE